MRYLEVGSYYKNPKYPVWVLGSSSHYTVLFGVDQTIGRKSPAELYRQRVDVAFESVDQQNQGFIAKKDTGRVLQLLGINFPNIAEFNFIADPDDLQVVLKQSFHDAISALVQPPELSQVGGAGPKKFDLYHWNGIKNVKKENDQFNKLTVEPDGPFV